jgi:hypothetical protein
LIDWLIGWLLEVIEKRKKQTLPGSGGIISNASKEIIKKIK